MKNEDKKLRMAVEKRKLSRADKNKADRKTVAASSQRIKDKKRRKVGGLDSGSASHLRDILYRGGKPFKAPKEDRVLKAAKGDKSAAKSYLDAERDFRGGKYSATGEPSNKENQEYKKKNKKK